jgi:hypothetical protein
MISFSRRRLETVLGVSVTSVAIVRGEFAFYSLDEIEYVSVNVICCEIGAKELTSRVCSKLVCALGATNY